MSLIDLQTRQHAVDCRWHIQSFQIKSPLLCCKYKCQRSQVTFVQQELLQSDSKLFSHPIFLFCKNFNYPFLKLNTTWCADISSGCYSNDYFTKEAYQSNTNIRFKYFKGCYSFGSQNLQTI